MFKTVSKLLIQQPQVSIDNPTFLRQPKVCIDITLDTLHIYINCLTHQGQVCPRTVAPHPSPPDALLLRRGL